MKNLIAIILLCSLLFSKNICLGQSITDSLQNRPVVNATISNFNKNIGEQSLLYNGTDVFDYGPEIKGNAYFKDTIAMSNGKLTYCGFTYTNIPLLYDLFKDLLITVRFNGNATRFAFVSEKVSEFTLFDHHFIRLDPDSITGKVIKPGFYDDLYTNKLQVLAKRGKYKDEKNSTVQLSYEIFKAQNYYYLKKNDRYYPVDGEGDFINVLKDHKDEMKKYIKDKKIKFRADPEKAMILLATYYDNLTN